MAHLQIIARRSMPSITTKERIAEDLRRSLQLRGVDIGSTFGELLLALRRLGIRDADPIASIEVGIGQAPSGRIVAELDDAGAWEVKEAK